MTTITRTLGAHGFFFRDGTAYTVPSSGTASRTSKPGATDPAWVDLGVIDEIEVTKASEEHEIFAPSPGKKRLYDVIEGKSQLTLKIGAQELSPLLVELIFGTAALTASSAQFNPLEGASTKGWLKLQFYDQTDASVIVVDVFCFFKHEGGLKFGSEPVKGSITARVLHSTLNTGSL